MPVQDRDRGVTLPFPIKTREVYKGDNPAVTTGTGSKIEFVEEIYRGNVRLRVDEFAEFAPGSVLSTTSGWQARSTGTPTSNGIKANTSNGIVEGVFAATNEAETVGVDWGDQLLVPATKQFYFQALVNIPTALAANSNLIVGLGTAYNATLNSISKYVRFRTSGSMAVTVDSKDGTTTSNGQAISRGGFTITAGLWVLFTIDATKVGFVRYFINDAQVFSQSLGAFAGTDLLQPMIYLNKSTGTATSSLQIDWVRVNWNRF